MRLHTYSIYYHLFIPEAPGTAAAETGLKPQAADKMPNV
jgi:hypothetical protein